jgi:hypothetical protein
MAFDPINPVALVARAASTCGAACALELARRADGGLVLTDSDAEALDACADSLERAPERVSTLAFDAADPERWRQAIDFIAAHYGRLDWALLDAGAGFPRKRDYLDAAWAGFEATMPLIGDNRDGGAILLLASATELQAELDSGAREGLLGLLQVAAARATPLQVRVAALAFGDAGSAELSALPMFADILSVNESAGDAFAALAARTPPFALYPEADLAQLLPLALAEAFGGSVLVVNGPDTL